jgi:hypothetical protein
MNRKRLLVVAGCLLTVMGPALAQDNGTVMTQLLVRAESKANVVPDPASVKLELDSKATPVLSMTALKPAGVQIALIIDDGLSRNAGMQLGDLRDFVRSLPPGAELLVGYMSNGSVRVASDFTSDRSASVQALRIPTGVVGQSASPYFCLSDFVKRWPRTQGASGAGKARVVMMITNGVDPYNGSTGLDNQDSPYVNAAVLDSQRAGVAVYSIYYRDAGFGRGGSAAFSGQGYLQQVAEGTGGQTYYEGTGSPISLTPFFKQFLHAISETYVASFMVDPQSGGREHLVRIKLSTSTPKLKLRHADAVRPGNREMGATAGMAGQP